MAIENTVSIYFFIRVRRMLRPFLIAAYPVCECENLSNTMSCTDQ